MRTIIVGIYAVVVGIISLPFLLIELLVRLISPMAAARFAQFVVRIVFSQILFLSGAKKTIIGLEKIPMDTPVLYAANHRSFYDIILAYSTVPGQTSFVSKKEIGKIPCVAQWMFFLRCLFMDRSDIKQQLSVIKQCITQVKEGYSIYIAPEGTRNATDTLLTFKEGSLRIAHKTGCPIVPVCVMNTEAIFENSLPWIHGGKILIEYGDPIYLDQLSPEDKKHVGAYTQKIIADMYAKHLSFLEK